MTTTQSIQIYDILSIHFKNKEDAKLVVQSIEKVIDEKVETKTIVFEKIVTKDIENLRQEMYKVFASKDDIGRLETKIAESKVDTIKWVFAFFVTLALMIVGLYLKK